jgi:hypothetical protein
MRTTITLAYAVLFIAATITAQDKGGFKIGGYMFGDYFYNIARDTSLASLSNVSNSGAKDLNGFQFRRIYLTFDNEISSTFSARFRLEGTNGAPVIKDAYLKWKNIFSGSDLVFGIQPTPISEASESYWEFRPVEKTLLDLRGIVSSRDLGVSLKGTLFSDGSLNYWFLAGNNSSTGAETDKYKRLYAQLELKPFDRFRMTIYADYRMQSSINDPASTTIPKKTLGTNVLTTALIAGYSEKGKYSVGAEGMLQTADHGYLHGTSPVIVEDKQGIGLSLFGNIAAGSDLTLLARYDYFDPNSAADHDLRQLIIAGVSWSAEKNVSIIPNVQYESYEQVAAATGNRAVDPSITAKITFYYIFL